MLKLKFLFRVRIVHENKYNKSKCNIVFFNKETVSNHSFPFLYIFTCGV